jgi:hypothetical protein
MKAFQSQEEGEALSTFMQQLERTTASTSTAVDEAIAFVEASNRRMVELEKLSDAFCNGTHGPVEFLASKKLVGLRRHGTTHITRQGTGPYHFIVFRT